MVGLSGVGLALLFAALPACGSGSTKCGTNCNKADATIDVGEAKRDADSGKRDALVDHASEMDAVRTHDASGDGPHDAREPVDLANPCDQSVAAACAATNDGGAFSVHCAATWDATTHNAYLCARPATLVLTRPCGDYQELFDTNGNDEYVYIYDASGALYAVTHIKYQEGGVVSHCVAGSPGFVDPSGCGNQEMFSCLKDGGTRG
jgi:hypothetical protein